MDTLSPLDDAVTPIFTSAISPLYTDQNIEELEEEEVKQLRSLMSRVSFNPLHLNRRDPASSDPPC